MFVHGLENGEKGFGVELDLFVLRRLVRGDENLFLSRQVIFVWWSVKHDIFPLSMVVLARPDDSGSSSGSGEAIVTAEAKSKSISNPSTFEGGVFGLDIGIEQEFVEEHLEVVDGDRQCGVDTEQGRVDRAPVIDLARTRRW